MLCESLKVLRFPKETPVLSAMVWNCWEIQHLPEPSTSRGLWVPVVTNCPQTQTHSHPAPHPLTCSIPVWLTEDVMRGSQDRAPGGPKGRHWALLCISRSGWGDSHSLGDRVQVLEVLSPGMMPVGLHLGH